MLIVCRRVFGAFAASLMLVAISPPPCVAAQQPQAQAHECGLLAREYPFVGMAFDIKSEKPMISSVTPGSPAVSAGIQAGDIVSAYNGITVTTYNEIITAIGQLKIGDTLKLTVLRNGRAQEFDVTIDRKPLGYTYIDCALSSTESPTAAERIYWLGKAAELGHVNAMMILGEIYSREEPRDFAAAMQWFNQAADLGDMEAQLVLGMYYYYGDDVNMNRAEAAKWLRLAAEQGSADARITLGLMYSTGDGVDKDYAEAVKWIQLAAEQGLAKAKCTLGVMYNYGLGVKRDPQKAFNLIEEAANHGDANAKYHLALFYIQGTVVRQDQDKAVALLLDAADRGSLEARALRDSLGR
jgi:TPR repeat protein